MDEVAELCRRILGASAAADEAVAQARAEAPPGAERIALLTAAARACRSVVTVEEPIDGGGGTDAPDGLAAAVARELAAATAKLPERQREALALRDMLRLSYEQIATVMEIDSAAVAPLLARARLRLRAERRGTDVGAGADCEERDRALRLLAARQDSEPMSGEDDEWLFAHLAACPSCETAHAAMLEAAVCYRAWPREQPAAT